MTQPGFREGISRISTVVLWLMGAVLLLMIFAVVYGAIFGKFHERGFDTSKWREVLIGIALAAAVFGYYFGLDLLRENSYYFRRSSKLHKNFLGIWGILSSMIGGAFCGFYYIAVVVGKYQVFFDPFNRGLYGAVLTTLLAAFAVWVAPVLIAVPGLRVLMWIANGFGASIDTSAIESCGVSAWLKRYRLQSTFEKDRRKKEFAGLVWVVSRAVLIGLVVGGLLVFFGLKLVKA